MPQTLGAGLVILLLVPINLAAIGCLGLVTLHLTIGWGLPLVCMGAFIAQLPYIIKATTIVSPLSRDEYDRQMMHVRWIRILGMLLMLIGTVWSLIGTTVEGRPLVGSPAQQPWLPWDHCIRIAAHLLANFLILLAAFCDLIDLAAIRSTRAIASKSNVI